MKKILILLSLLLIIASCSEQQKGINPRPNFDSLWNYQQPDSTEMVFQKILENLHDSVEMSYDQEYHVELLTQIARAQGLQGKFEQAFHTLNTADSLLQDSMFVPKIRYLLEKGRVYYSNKNLDTAKKFFLEAYQFGEKKDLEFYSIDAAHMLGIVAEPQNQMKWNLKALDLAEKSEDQRCKKWLGTLYNNIGWTFHDEGKFGKALAMFKKDLAWRQKNDDLVSILIAKWSVGRTLRSLDKIAEAMVIQQELVEDYQKNNMPISGYVLEELGELHLVQKSDEKAADYFSKAYKILSKDAWLQKFEKDRLERIKKLGK